MAVHVTATTTSSRRRWIRRPVSGCERSSKASTAQQMCWASAEIERPSIGADEVLVKVRAAALDRGTWHLMAGLPYAARLAVGLRAPKNTVPGLDVAGVVVAVGSEMLQRAAANSANEPRLMPNTSSPGWKRGRDCSRSDGSEEGATNSEPSVRREDE